VTVTVAVEPAAGPASAGTSGRLPVRPGARETGRSRKVRRAVEQAMELHLAVPDAFATAPPIEPGGPVLRSLPRREQLAAGEMAVGATPQRNVVGHRAGWLATLARFVEWLWAALLFGLGTFGDVVTRRDSPQRRAVRLRRTLERMGGTFLKMGQQMSIRLDLLPAPMCAELSKLLDRVPPFDSALAVAAVERATGRPLADTFAAFDPVPIGSASISCVYQAVLRSGEKVAVKVRRPGIVETFAADWRALSWTVSLLEALSVVRAGQLGSFVRDLQAMFREELDFRREARHADLFRKSARQSQLTYLDTPRIHFELSTDEVMVSEFVAGVWLWELLWAVESGDQRALAAMRARGVDAEEVGRRLYRTSLFGIFENMLFHADPHPANVVVRPGNQLVLVDFGSCGSFNERQLVSLRQLQYCQARGDVGGMVRTAFELLEPLPPVDVDAMTREAEAVFADSIRAIESKHSEWWERTSAGVWIGFMGLVRRYQIRIDLDVLRMIRSSLLYDTLAARLYPRLDAYAEYRTYRKRMAAAARKRFDKRLRKLFRRGVDDAWFLRFEELGDLAPRLAYRLERIAQAPTFKFSALAGKAFYAISSYLRLGLLGVGLLATATGVRLALDLRDGIAVAPLSRVVETAASPLFLAGVALLLLLTTLRVVQRFDDRDT
jgi:ubiquinone biosynthesis protein